MSVSSHSALKAEAGYALTELKSGEEQGVSLWYDVDGDMDGTVNKLNEGS